MIYTVTFNPAIDYVMHTPALTPGAVNRSKSEEIYFGGKGINVSLVLKELGVASKALGFTAGFTGEAIEKGLEKMGLDTDFVRLKEGSSRINVKIKGGAETELNGTGPDISEADVKRLLEKLDLLKEGDTLVLAGSIPPSLPPNIYEQILSALSGRGVRFVVDASGELLVNVLKYEPFLIKPNKDELSEIFRAPVHTDEEIEKYALQLREMGALNVLVSMAGEGALLLDGTGRLHRAPAHMGMVKNSVGAGDSMVAGFIAGYLESGSYSHALTLGTAAGAATAFSDGLATIDSINALLTKE